MISHSHHVKSNKKWVSSRSSPNFILAQCLYVGNSSGVKACGLHTSEAETGIQTLTELWLLCWIVTLKFEEHCFRFLPAGRGGPLLCWFSVSVAGSHDPGGMWKLSLWRTNQEKLLLRWDGLWELLPHGTRFLFPGCVLSHFSHIQLFVTPRTVDCRLLYPWDSLGKNTGVGCYAFLQGIFSTQASTQVSYVSCLASEFFTAELPGSPSLS